MVFKFFHKKSSGSGVNPEPNYQLENELHGQIIRKFKIRKVDDFSILTTESNEFKLHLKESLLIKRNKPELNRNCYTHPLELFD